MKEQNEQQELQLINEANLDQVTGGMQPGSYHLGGVPWNHPFDSPIEAPAARKIITADPGVDSKTIGTQLNAINKHALQAPHLAEGVRNVHIHSDGTMSVTHRQSSSGKLITMNVPIK